MSPTNYRGCALLHPLMPPVTEELWQRLPFEEICGRERSIAIGERTPRFIPPLDLDAGSHDESCAESRQVRAIDPSAISMLTRKGF